MEQINSEYFSDQPHAYGGKYRLYDLYNKDDVDKALSYNDVYTKFKQHRKSKSIKMKIKPKLDVLILKNMLKLV